MTDPQQTVAGAGRSDPEGRIDALLVSGLDAYLAGDFESAIHIWTRVLFLDRDHGRARAYIERARTALAERQRRTDLLAAEGVDTFERGEVERARALFAEVLDADASHDVALGMLSRLDRLAPETLAGLPAMRDTARQAMPRLVLADESRGASGDGRTWAAWLAVGVVLVGALAFGPAAALRPAAWVRPSTAIAPIPDSLTVLPEPRVSDGALRRCRALVDAGRVHDALAECGRIGLGDPRREEAEALVARVQRALLAVSAAPGPAVTGRGGAP
ncbi:MAG: hypothetical protein FJW29_02840 [Acidobacteria bacterium]|nr:hypothetical protein [Acidobacteriota bacterium]